MPVFQDVAPRHTIFTSSCAIPLWGSATAHSPSSKELNPSSQEDARFSGSCTSAHNFHFILRHPSLGLSNSSLTLRYKTHSFLSWKTMFLRAYCFVNVLTLSCLGSLWFGTHPYYSSNPYMYLYYQWSIFITKNHRYPKYFILYLVYFYSERPPPSKIFYSMYGLFLYRKTVAL